MASSNSLEQSNRAKYGDKRNDVIAQAFEMSETFGEVWCVFNAKKYIERFIRPGSTKGGNLTDIIKARDYLDRLIQRNTKSEIDDQKGTENG